MTLPACDRLHVVRHRPAIARPVRRWTPLWGAHDPRV